MSFEPRPSGRSPGRRCSITGDRDGAEVDLVLEAGDGRVVGIEVKAGGTVRSEDLRGLRLLEARLGDDFAAGIVICTAPSPVHVGRRLWIVPVSALWSPDPGARLSGDEADRRTGAVQGRDGVSNL